MHYGGWNVGGGRTADVICVIVAFSKGTPQWVPFFMFSLKLL